MLFLTARDGGTMTRDAGTRTTSMQAIAALRGWTARRWGAAALASAGSLVLLGIPTAMIPNPV